MAISALSKNLMGTKQTGAEQGCPADTSYKHWIHLMFLINRQIGQWHFGEILPTKEGLEQDLFYS